MKNSVTFPSAGEAPGYFIKASGGGPVRLQLLSLPAWREAWIGYLFYLLICGGLTYLLIRLFRIRTTLKKESEFYEARLDFFTGISHELRTYLSLVEGRLEKAFGLLEDNQAAKHHLNYARSNSQQLKQLLNELLDLRKSENGGLQLSVNEYDLVKIIKTILSSFEHIAAEKRITARFIHPDSAVSIWFDLLQMKKVFHNLLTNAFKFTPEDGWVSVEIEQSVEYVVVSVTNNGSGISDGDIDHLFNKFFQGQDNDSQEGHGIGLALSKSIVDLHQAKLVVTSRHHNNGQNGQTRFAVHLLPGTRHYSSDQFAKSEAVLPEYPDFEVSGVNESEEAALSEKKYTLLVIEDNDEFRMFEKELLSETYHVLDTASGSDGLQMAFENIPDLILCDVIMPEQNGIQLCTQLKADIRTSHIPIILLTVQSALSQVIQGLQAGADDYLVKPVNVNILLLKIQNSIKARTEIRRFTDKALSLRTDEWSIAGANDEFIDKLRSLVVENVSLANFGVNEMAFQVGMSVSALYRKVRSLTGMTVHDFMKAIKMQTALRLLQTGSYQVNEVALMVGYESVRYFSSEFKKLYGKPPSKFRSQSGE